MIQIGLPKSLRSGKDKELDVMLAKADVLGNMAHLKMLHKIGLMDETDLRKLEQALREIYADVEKGNFKIEDGIEDVHSQIEYLLTENVARPGKKFIQVVPAMIRF